MSCGLDSRAAGRAEQMGWWCLLWILKIRALPSPGWGVPFEGTSHSHNGKVYYLFHIAVPRNGDEVGPPWSLKKKKGTNFAFPGPSASCESLCLSLGHAPGGDSRKQLSPWSCANPYGMSAAKPGI